MAIATITRFAAAIGVCLLVAGCGTVDDVQLSAADLAFAHHKAGARVVSPAADPTFSRDDLSDTGPSRVASSLECVPYARARSGLDIRGDAYTWWEKAAGLYRRSHAPSEGSVMVMVGYAGRHRGHVAVVRRMVTSREIRVDHANWLNDGAIYVNDPILDVSPDNDWSQVKVWNVRSGSWGTKVYAVRGFIGPAPASSDALASKDDPIARQIALSDANIAPTPRVAARHRRANVVR